MKQSIIIIREILSQLEELRPGDTFALKINGYDSNDVEYNYSILEGSGLIEHYVFLSSDGHYKRATRITWAGQEFLSNSRSKIAWEKAVAVAEDHGGVSFAVFQQLLEKKVAEAVGIIK